MINNVSNSQVSFSGPTSQLNKLSRRLCGGHAIFTPNGQGMMFADFPIRTSLIGSDGCSTPLLGAAKTTVEAAADILKQIKKGDIIVVGANAELGTKFRVTKAENGVQFVRIA